MIITRQHYVQMVTLASGLRQELAGMQQQQEPQEAMLLKRQELMVLEAQIGHWLGRATGGGYYQAIQVVLKAMGAAHDQLKREEVGLVHKWLTQLEQEVNQLNLLLDNFLTLVTVLEMDSELEPELRDAVALARQLAGEAEPTQDGELL